MRKKPTTPQMNPKAEEALRILTGTPAPGKLPKTTESSDMGIPAIPVHSEPPVSPEREIAVPGEKVHKFHGFIAWLQTPEGRDSADPRWLPVEPSRREMELERRLRCAWDAARL